MVLPPQLYCALVYFLVCYNVVSLSGSFQNLYILVPLSLTFTTSLLCSLWQHIYYNIIIFCLLTFQYKQLGGTLLLEIFSLNTFLRNLLN